MGGGDSKPEEQVQVQEEQEQEIPYVPPIPKQPANAKKNRGRDQNLPNSQQIPSKGKNISNNSMPKPKDGRMGSQSKQKINSKKDYIIAANNRKRNSQESYLNQIGSSNQLIYQQQESGQKLEYFSHWNQKFHRDGSMRMKVMVLTIKPTVNIKKLQKNISQHFGLMSWSYQKKQIQGESVTHLRIIFQQDGGYILNFLVNEQSNAVEGDSQIWDLICPFRTKSQTINIGGFDCQRTYEGAQEEQEEDDESPNEEIFRKWQQKVPEDRKNIKKLLQKRRQQQKLKRNEGIQYRETSKYFLNQEQWVSSMLIEQRLNSFRCWMIEALNPSPRAAAMSDTLRNDVENRESMYVQQMSKKKVLILSVNRK